VGNKALPSAAAFPPLWHPASAISASLFSTSPQGELAPQETEMFPLASDSKYFPAYIIPLTPASGRYLMALGGKDNCFNTRLRRIFESY